MPIQSKTLKEQQYLFHFKKAHKKTAKIITILTIIILILIAL